MFGLNSPLADTPNAKDYIDIMCEIRKLALYHEFEENTPSIVVFGDQSSGKSSVLQRLTGGLPMPRGSTKCTANPFEIRMLQTDEPLRHISLRYVEDKNSKPIHPREIDFADITNLGESEIEDKLREAQRYVQNPSITDVSKTRLPDNDELAFTKNTVCVTISGPDQLYSLSMVDLPGVVRDNENHENFVLSLVKEYIKKESAILVPIFQATSDIATQCAWRLAREADPAGQRTVGVLTKMDRIIEYQHDDEKHIELATLVKGKGEHQLVNGTYIIRNPSGPREMNEDATDLEKATISALKMHRIWRDVPSDRYGLQNLTIKLSDLQRKAHERSWPKIRPFLEDRRAELEEKLNALPLPPDGDPTIRFLELIGDFDNLFRSHANAEHIDHRFYRGQQWNFGQFDQALLNTRPRYKLAFDGESINEMFDPIKPGALQYRAWTKSLRDEIGADDWGDMNEELQKKYIWGIDQLCETVQGSQGGQVVGYFPYKAVVAIVAKHQEDWHSISTELLNKNHDWVGQFTDEMVEKIFREFPNAVEEVKRELRQLLRKRKDDTLKRLKELEAMEHMSASRALYVTDEASLLKKQSKYFIKYRILAATSRQGNQDLRSIVDLGTRLFDMMYDDDADEDEFERIKSDLINILSGRDLNESSQRLIEEIRSARIMADDMPSTATVSMMLSIKNSFLDKLIGVTPKSNEDVVNQSALKNTINEHAFLAATGALAYWKMSHAKFREIVPRLVEYYLVHQFATQLGMMLRTCFNLSGGTNLENPYQNNEHNLKDLLGENPENARNRKDWRENIDALSAIIDRVRRASIKNRNSSGSGSGKHNNRTRGNRG